MTDPSVDDDTRSRPDERSLRKAEALRKAKLMVAWSVGIAVAGVIILLVLFPAQFMEFRLSVLLKLGAGVLATILLGAGLMAVSFYSNASGHDDDVPGA